MQTLILLHTEDKQKNGLVCLWEESNEILLQSIHTHKNKLPKDLKIYLLYNNQAPSSKNIQILREELDYEIIPIFSKIMEKALTLITRTPGFHPNPWFILNPSGCLNILSMKMILMPTS